MSISSVQNEETSSEDSNQGSLPKSVVPKRQKKIFRARKNLQELWANRPPNLFAEKEYNNKCGRLYPFCSICQYFISRERWQNGTQYERLPERLLIKYKN